MPKKKQIETSNSSLAPKDILEILNRDLEEEERLYLASEEEDLNFKTDLRVIPTGSFSLDLALGIGGWPRGSVSELYGRESVGKSFLALLSIKEAQRLYPDEMTVYCDLEQYLRDIKYNKKLKQRLINLGIDLDRLFLIHLNEAEKLLNKIQQLLEICKVSIIVIDSVASMVTATEEEGGFEDTQIAGLARLMGKAARKLVALVAKSDTALLLINQIRDDVGYGASKDLRTPGGHTLAHLVSTKVFLDYASKTGTPSFEKIKLHTRFSKPFYFDDKNRVAGAKIQATVVKNKKGPAFTQAFYDAYWDKGIDYEGEVLDLAVLYGLMEVTGTGGWYTYRGEKFARGREGAIKRLREDKDLCQQLAEEVKRTVLEDGVMVNYGYEDSEGTE